MTSTTTAVTSGTNPSAYGSSVTFTATVTPAPAGPAMTGSVSSGGSGFLGIATVNSASSLRPRRGATPFGQSFPAYSGERRRPRRSSQ